MNANVRELCGVSVATANRTVGYKRSLTESDKHQVLPPHWHQVSNFSRCPLFGHNNHFPSLHNRNPSIFLQNLFDFKHLFKYVSMAIKSIRLTFGIINAGPRERPFNFSVLIHLATVDAAAPVNSAASFVETMSGIFQVFSPLRMQGTRPDCSR